MFGSSEMRSIHFNNALRNTGGIDVPHLPTDMMLGRSIVRVLHEIVHDWSRAMDHVNIAVREGKAFDQLGEQLSHVPSFEEMIVDETSISNPEERECYVMIVMTEPPSREIQSSIAHTVAKVNMMNRTGIRARIMA